jgi:molybdopterin converting factor small subunit
MMDSKTHNIMLGLDLSDDQKHLLDRILDDSPSLCGTIEEDVGEIIGALYRRIERLDSALSDIEEVLVNGNSEPDEMAEALYKIDRIATVALS